MPNPATNRIPDSVTCPRCIGWGTIIKATAPTLVKCPVCEGTGRRPVPESEIEQ